MELKKTILVFVSLVVLSPWFLILLKNHRLILKEKLGFFQFQNQVLISEINTLRGESKKEKVGLLGLLIVNKLTWNGKEIASRFLESFDFHYLFIEGDLNILKSTKTSGPLYLSLLPFVIFGFYSYFKNKIFWPTVFFLAPIFSSVINQHYETISRLPFILGLTFVAAFGIVKFSCIHKRIFLKTIFFVFYVFEFLRFIHYYFIHFPLSLSE